MIVNLGEYGIALALLAAAGALVTAVAAIRLPSDRALSAGRWLLGAHAALIGLASLALLQAFLTDRFDLAYVAGYSERAMPAGFKFAAFWAGQSGSLLLWALLLAGMTVTALVAGRKLRGADQAAALGVLAIVNGFFAALMLFADDANPFLRQTAPADGHGLNPMLQDPWMIIHPPLTFAGYAAYTLPFAFLLGNLITRKAGGDWLRSARRWSLFAWITLSLGIILGAKWAYVELGWGGYWAWDPVENASLLPWLTGTALLHSLAVSQQRSAFKGWTAGLIAASFVLCILATYLTRSGVVASVHAFGDSLVATLFLGFLVASILGSAAVLLWRHKDLRSTKPLDSLQSKEGMFLITNVLLVIMTAVTLIGTIFPVLSQVVSDQPITVKPAFYNRVVLPMGLVLLGLMAISPLIGYGRAGVEGLKRGILLPLLIGVGAAGLSLVLGVRSLWMLATILVAGAGAALIVLDLGRAGTERVRRHGEGPLLALLRLIDTNHRRYGGQLVHIGMLMLMLGVAGSSVLGQKEVFEFHRGPDGAYHVTDGSSQVAQGSSHGHAATLGGYHLSLQGMGEERGPNYTAVQAHITLTDAKGRTMDLHPQTRYYDKSERPNAEVALRSSLGQDVYVTLAGWEAGGRMVAIEAYVNPLVSWIWIGSVVAILGASLCLLPRLLRRSAAQTQTLQEPAAAPEFGGLVTGK